MSLRSSKKCWLLMAEYQLSPAAERDLEAIWVYAVQQWGVVQADRYTNTVDSGLCRVGSVAQNGAGL
jgi:plasmid stabilization system protein ParE